MRHDTENYLVEIDQDRYRGCYSGHSYTAWRGVRPEDIDGGDPDCQTFWEEEAPKLTYGGGETPQEAFRDLIEKLISQGCGIYEPDYHNTSTVLVVLIFHWGRPDEVIPVQSPVFTEWIGETFSKSIKT